MPSKTFLNLPKDKQKTLMEAAEREFSRVDFSSSSINQIIQDAGISRGSFYMYFEDKEDLYFYVLEKHVYTLYCRFLKYLDENAGDFIQAWHQLHTYILTSCLQKENSLFKNMFLNMRYTTDRKMSLKPPKEVIREKHQELISHIDKNKYRYSSDEELLEAFSLVMLVSMSSIAYTLMNPKEQEKEAKIYDQKLDIIRYGVMRKEK